MADTEDAESAVRERRIRWLRMNMAWSPRCGARTRAGTRCRAPAVHGKSRCRMHGGARLSGARHGNRNSLKHGHFTATAKAEHRRIAAFIREAEASLRELKE